MQIMEAPETFVSWQVDQKSTTLYCLPQNSLVPGHTVPELIAPIFVYNCTDFDLTSSLVHAGFFSVWSDMYICKTLPACNDSQCELDFFTPAKIQYIWAGIGLPVVGSLFFWNQAIAGGQQSFHCSHHFPPKWCAHSHMHLFIRLMTWGL